MQTNCIAAAAKSDIQTLVDTPSFAGRLRVDDEVPSVVAIRRMTRIMSGAAKNAPAKYHRHAAATGHTTFHSIDRIPATTAMRKTPARKISPTRYT
jgi:hypothetical protein